MKKIIKKILIVSLLFFSFVYFSVSFKSFIFLLISIIILSSFLIFIEKINKNFLLFYFTFLISIVLSEIFLKLEFNKIFETNEKVNANKKVIAFDNFKYERTYLGNQLEKGTYNHYKKKGDKFIFNENYYVNQNNFRSNQLIKNNETKILTASFFGGSDVFGWGLSDKKTLPYLFYEKNKQFNIFNYGMIGGSINQTLEMIKKNNDYLGDVNIVVTSSYQLPRIACNRDYSFNAPVYEMNEQKLKFSGYCFFSFLKLKFQAPRIIGSIINRSELVKLLNNVFSKEYTKKNIRDYLGILNETNSIVKNNNKKLVILYYGSNKILDKKIKEYMLEYKIPHIDVSLYDKKFYIKHDKHFNKLAYEMWLEKLSKYLIATKL